MELVGCLYLVQYLIFQSFKFWRYWWVLFDVVDCLIIEVGMIGIVKFGLDIFIGFFGGGEIVRCVGDFGGDFGLYNEIDLFVGCGFVFVVVGNCKGIDLVQGVGVWGNKLDVWVFCVQFLVIGVLCYGGFYFIGLQQCQ